MAVAIEQQDDFWSGACGDPDRLCLGAGDSGWRMIFPVDIFSGELVRSAPLHFVSLTEEVPRSVIDMLIDGLVCRREGAVGEVGRPTAQNAVQPCSHFVPSRVSSSPSS